MRERAAGPGPFERLLGSVPPGTKVTMVTAPWRPSSNSDVHRNRNRHAVAFFSDEPDLAVQLCYVDKPLAVAPATEPLTDCPKCVRMLTGHGLWPL